MEFPWRCTCGHENMIDLEHLSKWPLDKLMSARGFQCERCGMWEAIAYETISLEEQKRNLLRYAPGHPKFKFLFAKVLKKAEGINQRGESLYGKVRRENMATAR